MQDYQAFLRSKAITAPIRGTSKAVGLKSHLFQFQKECVQFGLRVGSFGLFLDTGLGKTACELEWASHAAAESNGRALILTPLAVARQIEAEGKRWGYDTRVIRSQEDAREGINVCNYDRLQLLSPDEFGAVVLDESSVLKNFSGKTTRALIETFARHQWRMAATATPAPNDHVELGNHSEFLGIMPLNDMLVRWFINDTADTGTWRLKGHARELFWDWMASWSRMAEHPRDLGDMMNGFDLPQLRITTHESESSSLKPDGTLFSTPEVSATRIHDIKRQTVEARCKAVVAALDGDFSNPVVIWCDTDYEADALVKALRPLFDKHLVEVRGSMSIDAKEEALARFSDGSATGLISKPSICGFGLNWQHCNRMIFVGRSFSYEAWYQAVRRCWRFGQLRDVNVHLIVAEGEDAIGRVIDRKADDHATMKREMSTAMQRAMKASIVRVGYEPTYKAKGPLDSDTQIRCLNEAHGKQFSIYHGDCVDVTRQMADESIDFSIYSPPFSNLFVYSDSIADMGNSADDREFFQHYGYLIRELYRLTVPGRLSAVHCSDIPLTKWKDGVIAIKDLSGGIIRAHEAAGWALHSRITIWKSPVVEMTRTKALGLLHKQLLKDSGRSRAGMPDYLLVFRKTGYNPRPIEHTAADFPVVQWQEWASPVWMSVDQTNVLNVAIARSDADEKHLCPLQLDVIDRGLVLWSNPGDVVLSPFMGVGSEGVRALTNNRRFIGIELKAEYFSQAVANIDACDRQTTLF